MRKINITISDDLKPSEEAAEIFQQLQRKALGQKSTAKRIGQALEIKERETVIVVTREAKEKPIKTQVCTCGTTYEAKLARVLWVNYGGVRRKVLKCSDECMNLLKSVIPDNRMAGTRSNLKTLRKF